MFGIGLTEIVVIAVVALIFLRPKDLPRLFRTMGKAYRRITAEVGEFKEMLDAAGAEPREDTKMEEGDRK